MTIVCLNLPASGLYASEPEAKIQCRTGYLGKWERRQFGVSSVKVTEVLQFDDSFLSATWFFPDRTSRRKFRYSKIAAPNGKIYLHLEEFPKRVDGLTYEMFIINPLIYWERKFQRCDIGIIWCFDEPCGIDFLEEQNKRNFPHYDLGRGRLYKPID